MGLEGIRATVASVINANHHEEALRTATQNNLFAHLGSAQQANCSQLAISRYTNATSELTTQKPYSTFTCGSLSHFNTWLLINLNPAFIPYYFQSNFLPTGPCFMGTIPPITLPPLLPPCISFPVPNS